MIKETNVLDGSPMFNSKVFSILIVGLISRLPLCVFVGHWRASAAAMGRVEIGQVSPDVIMVLTGGLRTKGGLDKPYPECRERVLWTDYCLSLEV